jgi:hypothetical protein
MVNQQILQPWKFALTAGNKMIGLQEARMSMYRYQEARYCAAEVVVTEGEPFQAPKQTQTLRDFATKATLFEL